MKVMSCISVNNEQSHSVLSHRMLHVLLTLIKDNFDGQLPIPMTKAAAPALTGKDLKKQTTTSNELYVEISRY